MLNQPLEDTNVVLTIPQDVSVSDAAEAVDLINLRVARVTIHASNPRIWVAGGPGIDSIVITVVSSGAVGYIAAKFFDHVVDEGIARVLAKLSAIIRRKRRDERQSDQLPWFVWTFTNSADEYHVESVTLSGRFESAEEVMRMGRRARELIGTYDDAGISGENLIWRRTTGSWHQWDPASRQPDDN